MSTTLSSDDKKKINKALRDISDSMTRQEAEKDLIKNIVKDICGEFEFNKRMFRRTARIYHKQNMEEEEQTHAEVKQLINSLTKK